MTGARKASLVLTLLILASSPALAGAGLNDPSPAATLWVPFFEVGIDPLADPQDTLLTVFSGPGIFHYHVWDRNGNPTDLQGNVSSSGSTTWPVSLRTLISAASPAARTALTVGSFYWGFVTIDAVTTNTSLDPTQSGYPFAYTNSLEGQIYYTRLSEGSANGLRMIALEALPETANSKLKFLGRREEIDVDAMACAQQLISGETCLGDADGRTSRIRSRVFLEPSPTLNGSSRIVIFAWNPFAPDGSGGPSARCDFLGTCDSTYTYRRYSEMGTLVTNTTVRLDHVVTVIDLNPSPSGSGTVSIWNVPNVDNDTQIYAFSFNQAKPSGAALNWDAIFESVLVP